MEAHRTEEEVREQYSEGVLEQVAEATGVEVAEVVAIRQKHHSELTAYEQNIRREAQRQQVEWAKENLEFTELSDQ